MIRALLTVEDQALHVLADDDERVAYPDDLSVCAACGLVLDAPSNFYCAGEPRCWLWTERRLNVGAFIQAGLRALHGESAMSPGEADVSWPPRWMSADSARGEAHVVEGGGTLCDRSADSLVVNAVAGLLVCPCCLAHLVLHAAPGDLPERSRQRATAVALLEQIGWSRSDPLPRVWRIGGDDWITLRAAQQRAKARGGSP